jgi:hypothetical protein
MKYRSPQTSRIAKKSTKTVRNFRNLLATTLLAVTAAAILQPAWGQGCIVARSNGDVGGPESEGGYLQPGDFDFDIGYRHQFSYIHFVGPTEQSYRVADGTEVENKINLENLSVTYQLTSRFSITADVPVLTASRHTNDSPVIYTSSGIGDSSFMVQGWLWNPKENKRGNIQISFGLLAPTGKDNVANVVDAQTGKGPVYTIVDYSIQPGQGSWGLPLQWVTYKNWANNQLYFNGDYVMMLQDTNNVVRTGAAANPLTLTQYNAVSDQYLLEAGVAHPISRIRGLTITFGPRMEGVPSRNLLPVGNNLGFRRPGFAISLEPGIQYSRGRSVFSAEIARAIYRDRTRSVPDDLTGGHGDAAFANYVWLASYSFRFSPHGSPHHDSAKSVAPAASASTSTN